jgi:LuxR family maltose regulon positive regulatory protein
VAAAQGNVDGAIRLLKAWYQFSLERGCNRSAIELGTELVSFSMRRDDKVAAGQYMRNVLRLGQGRFIRCIVDQGRWVRDALYMLVDQAGTLPEEEAQYAEALLGVFSAERIPQRDASAERGSERGRHEADRQLGRRELDILELAADDLSNREIAVRLALSENTVKWYWKQIFEKLQVRRRTRAVNVARSAGAIF